MTTANEPVAPWGSFESLAVGSPTATGQTTRDMVHDLKNLLTPILGYVQLVLHDLPPTDAQYKRIEKIHRAALSARELVLHTLNDSASSSPSLNLNRRIRAFIEAVDGMIPENVRLESDLPADVGDVAADTGDLQRVLMNLVANACQAMPDGGTLRIQTARVAPPPRRNAASDGFVSSADVVRITVQDTGGGIAPDAVGRIFESGYTTKPGGTGLGLACVQRIVRSYGGWVDVDSIPHAGTAVHIFLPCTPSAVAAAKVG